jgi:hypothetical protein
MPSHDPSRVSRIFAALGDANRALDIEEAAYPVTRYQLARYRCSAGTTSFDVCCGSPSLAAGVILEANVSNRGPVS